MNGIFKQDREFSKVVDDMFNDVLYGIKKFSHDYPKVNSLEDGENYKIEFYCPGLKKENFKISIDNKILTISSNFSKEKDEGDKKYWLKEFLKSEFSRKFILPDFVIKDKIKASYEEGVLNVIIPKDKDKETKNHFEIKIN
jgi:HSP20 family protein